MMEQVARVIEQDDSGWVMVEVEMKSACSHCASSETCGSGAIAKAFSPKVQRFALPTSRPCQPGDLLKLGLPESVLLKAAALVYLLPVAGLLLGGLIGQMLLNNLGLSQDWMVMLVAFAGALGCWGIGRRRAKLLEQGAQPVILSYLGSQLSSSSGGA
ncbi:sigma E factor positive regulatory protein RseC [Shewanella sp. NFH-SH190041]|uniref:SoxR reducing system RseC family protein n=1 Tax=Shewanella sp. NFH-SH190041 TaxID=2950245 RepID=UPI0021C2F02C|nr:SoxR reducing system RseC family protein [Shewanella sp. NFH-SH190041]BDM63625.1 sigma E factor positive regulatory protein RseC [Shewanella sp. NFH-SH190041]